MTEDFVSRKSAGLRLQQSPIQDVLALCPLAKSGPDVFTNIHKPWNPPWGRGNFGGAAISQCLIAAQATVSAELPAHSMHCYFILAAHSEIPTVYNVERVRDGRTFATRTVQAKQKGKCIFTTTISFMRQSKVGKKIEHAPPMAEDLVSPPDILKDTQILSKSCQTDECRPYDCIRCPVAKGGRPETRKLRHWIRARGRIMDSSLSRGTDEKERQEGLNARDSSKNHQAHVAALAYMTDNYFIGTVGRVHNASRFVNKQIAERALGRFHGSEEEKADRKRYFEDLTSEEIAENSDEVQCDKKIDMMVSLDHTIFFHEPLAFRADEWMLVEMDTPWAGNERGLAMQRIWSKEGLLIATCIQEGLVRLFQDRAKSHL